MPASADTQRDELATQRRKVDFDSYDITVDELVRRVHRKRIEISPAYQRQFRWDHERQSRLIESLLLGIPVPPLFMATNVDASEGTSWEVVDGLQRLLSLVNFIGDTDTRKSTALTGDSLSLTGMEKLESLEGFAFNELPPDIQNGLEDRPIRVIVLNDKSDLQVRFDLFERLNTGGIRLTDHEVRECVFMGDFINLLVELSEMEEFKTVVRLAKGNQKDGTAQEYVLRFFAFHDRYKQFDHSVKDFLNEYCEYGASRPRLSARRKLFKETFEYLAEVFPDGLKSRKGTTPVNLYEGLAVGAALALDQDPDLDYPSSVAWVSSAEMRNVTTGATNNRSRVTGRIELSRDHFLAGS